MKINEIYNEDCIRTLLKMPNNFIDGVITSPPYNIAVKRNDVYYNNGYSHLDNLTDDKYIHKRVKEFIELNRVLKDRGVICYNLGYHTQSPVLPFRLVSEIETSTNLTLVDVIVWKKNTSIPFQTSQNRLSRICEFVFIFTKKENVKNFICNKKVTKINSKTKQKFYESKTNFIEARNNDRIKTKHKATYSTELCEKLINLYFKKGHTIYDPFMGIGTTALSCLNNEINYVGSEIIKEFYETTIKRIRPSLNDTL